jgi:hypothetical protein
MPEVLVGLLRAFWPYMSGLFLFGAAGSYSVWGGTQSAQGTPGGILDTVWSVVKSIATAPANVLGAFTGSAHKAARSAVSHWALNSEKGTAAWFTHLNVLARETFHSNLATANAAAAAIATLSGRVTANARYKDGTTVKARATTALHAANTAIAREHALSSTFTRTHRAQVKLNVHYTAAIDSALPWALPRTRTRVGTLEREYDGLKQRTKALEDGAVETFKWLSAHRTTAAFGIFTGAVAWALSRLGYGFLRCRSWQNLGRQMKCSDANVLRDLLIGATAIALSTDLIELAKAEQAVVDELSTVVRDFWRV